MSVENVAWVDVDLFVLFLRAAIYSGCAELSVNREKKRKAK